MSALRLAAPRKPSFHLDGTHPTHQPTQLLAMPALPDSLSSFGMVPTTDGVHVHHHLRTRPFRRMPGLQGVGTFQDRRKHLDVLVPWEASRSQQRPTMSGRPSQQHPR